MPSRRVKSGRERGAGSRAAILRAAERIFAERGLAGARTDAIAHAAGVNKALLYYYFKGKDALYFAVVEEHVRELHDRVVAAIEAEGSVRAAMLAFVGLHFDFLCSRPYLPQLFHRIMMAGGPGLQRLERGCFIPLRERLIRLMERGMRSGELRRVDPGHALISLLGLNIIYFSRASIVRMTQGSDPYAPRRLARRKQEILDFVRYGLFRRPEERSE